MRLNILPEETEIVLEFLETEFDDRLDYPSLNQNKKPRLKDAADSTAYRTKGNELFSSKLHNEKNHELMWILYTKSLALAPNDSEELALAYGNRAALLFHFKKYLECIINCDRALFITKSDGLKLKLLHRKAHSLLILNEIKEIPEICTEAKHILKSSTLEKQVKKDFKTKFDKILSTSMTEDIPNRTKDSKLQKQFCDQLSKFDRHEDIPCAANFISIEYNDQWGKHIVAEQDIAAGELIAIEETFCMLTNLKGKYVCCSYCNQFSWISFPCEHCVDDIYCSRNCQKQAWAEYHCFECALYPDFFRDYMEEDDTNYNETLLLRLFLKICHKAGSFEQIIGELYSVDSCKNYRMRGFTDNVFDSQSLRSFFSLTSKDISTLDKEILYEQLHMISRMIFLLAKRTTFFEENYKYFTVEELLNDPQIVFSVIVFLKIVLQMPYNTNLLLSKPSVDNSIYGSYIGTFQSLFNHSCDANVECFIAKNNKIVIYAKNPIKKGSQLFLNYLNRESPTIFPKKEARQAYLREYYDFTCKCFFCEENWSGPLPSIMDNERGSLSKLKRFHEFMITLKNIQTGKYISYRPVILESIVSDLSWLAEKFSYYCKEYEAFAGCLKKLLQDAFGYCMQDFPKVCDVQVG